MLGNTASSLEIGDLPIVPADMRSMTLFADMREAMRRIKLSSRWKPKPGSGWMTIWRLVVLNKVALAVEVSLAAISAMLFYTPALFLQRLVDFMERDTKDKSWGLVYCFALFASNAIMFIGEKNTTPDFQVF
jgi:hypothetical protein